jgi:DNA-binding HxlR family transcriptional regulator
LRVVGKKWTLLILDCISGREAAQFGELKKSLAGISSTVLSERLAELEREGFVTKNCYAPRVEYSLTATAIKLAAMLEELDRWVSDEKSPLAREARIPGTSVSLPDRLPSPRGPKTLFPQGLLQSP